ncbi:multiple inositol polyphosphate phosphatase 1-like protein, partial [Trifolium pratense]
MDVTIHHQQGASFRFCRYIQYKVHKRVLEKMAKTITLFVLLILFLSGLHYSYAEEEEEEEENAFDVRKHLSTVSRYGVVKDITDNNFIPSKIPEECTPIHLNLV